MDLKNRRNDFYYEELSVTKNDAECCIAHARKIINGKVRPLITISNDLILPGSQNTIMLVDC